MKNTLSTIVTCPSPELQAILIEAIASASASQLVPEFRRNSESAERAIYPEGIATVIINSVSPAMYEKLGSRHRVTLAIEADEPIEAANRFCEVFKRHDLEAEVLTQAQPEFPDGFLVFVKVPVLDGILLLCIPSAVKISTIDRSVLAAMPRREPWSPQI